MATWRGTVQLGYKVSIAGGLCGAIWIAPWGAVAQDADAPSGPEITLDVSQRIEASDNFDLSATERSGLRSVTRLGFGFRSETRAQSLSLQSNVSLRYGSLDVDEDTVSDPNLTLAYTREGFNSRLTTRLSYSQSDADSTFLVGDGEFIFLVADEGLRRNIAGSVGLELGLEGPLGASFQLSRNDISYSGTLNPDLFDTTTTTGSAALRLALNPQTTARLSGTVSQRDTSGIGVDRDSNAVALSAIYEVSQAFRTNASINYTTIDLLGGPATAPVNRTEEGAGFSLGFEADRPRGTLAASVASDVGENGTRTSLNTSHSFELPRAQMTLSFGLSKTEGISGVNPLFGIQYAQELKRGGLNLSLSQRVGARSDNEEVRNTTLSVAYSHELTALSSFDTTLSLQDNTILGTSNDPDSSRVQLSLAYRHQLAQEWDLVSSYTHILSSNDDRADISSNTLSLGLQRRFNWFP